MNRINSESLLDSHFFFARRGSAIVSRLWTVVRLFLLNWFCTITPSVFIILIRNWRHHIDFISSFFQWIQSFEACMQVIIQSFEHCWCHRKKLKSSNSIHTVISERNAAPNQWMGTKWKSGDASFIHQWRDSILFDVYFSTAYQMKYGPFDSIEIICFKNWPKI